MVCRQAAVPIRVGLGLRCRQPSWAPALVLAVPMSANLVEDQKERKSPPSLLISLSPPPPGFAFTAAATRLPLHAGLLRGMQLFGFNPTKCKTQCRLGVGRIKLLRNKKQLAASMPLAHQGLEH